MIFIIGIDHYKHQYLFMENEKSVYDLKDEVRSLVAEEEVKLVAEEFSLAALKKTGIEKTIAQEIAEELDVSYKHIDPDIEERKSLGIRTREDTAKTLGINSPYNLSKEDIARINEKHKDADKLREEEWLRRIESSIRENIAVFCGFEHVKSFQELAESKGYDSVIHKVLD